ncbi:MAG: LptF/LptG family permease, partial [Candidatus Aenigmatarchaeota archaeon]
MKILRNYILKDLFLNFVFSFLLFSLVMVMGNLWTISDLIIRKGVNPLDAFKIFLFFFPSILRYTIPLACLLGVLLTMGRLLVDNELIAINIAGVSLFKILNLFIIIGLIISLFIFVLYNKIIPDFQYNYRNQVKNIYSKNISALIEPGVFLENFKNYIIYISDMKENKLKNIFIYETNEKEKSSKIIFAKKGEFVVEQNIL